MDFWRIENNSLHTKFLINIILWRYMLQLYPKTTNVDLSIWVVHVILVMHYLNKCHVRYNMDLFLVLLTKDTRMTISNCVLFEFIFYECSNNNYFPQKILRHLNHSLPDWRISFFCQIILDFIHLSIPLSHEIDKCLYIYFLGILSFILSFSTKIYN